MIGVYFSGTGNTRFCVEKFLNQYDGSAKAFSIEDSESVRQIKEQEEILFAYPVQYSNLPKIVRDFIINNSALWHKKKIFVLATMGLFSGDGAGLSARLFKKYGADIMGAVHLKMPDSIGDVKALKRPIEKNREIVDLSMKKTLSAVEKLKNDCPTREGLGFLYHIAGLFGQRLYFSQKTRNYTDKLKINPQLCIGCGLCVSQCPMKNLAIQNGNVVTDGMCTMCYRCVNHCPKQAITLLGNTVNEQCRIEKYVS